MEGSRKVGGSARTPRILDALGLPASRAACGASAYAVAGLVPGLLGILLVPLIAYGGLFCVTRLGPPFLSGVLTAARGLTTVDRFLLRRLVGEEIPAAPRPRRAVRDRDAWRGAAFAVVNVPLAVLLFCVEVPVRLYGLVLVSYPFWFASVSEDGHRGLEIVRDLPLDTWPRALAVAAAGMLLLAVAGRAGRGVLALHRALARALLAPGRLARRIHDLEETRALAVRDAAATLRRIERDLHDGAQARLVAVAMSLTRARAALDPARTDAAKARDLVDHSLANARTALAELRDLVRGIHPPVLDSGLDAALASLASDIGSETTRVSVRTHLPARPPEAVETIAYFCAAELLTNAARHARATTIEVTAQARAGALLLTVRDDGAGGARVTRAGSGLAGLAERVRTIDGALSLDSPPGGPTTATVRLPLPEDTPCAS
ncbi:sensor histidine kinase [Streptomyces sp. NPDC003077]|uniref:sensor histidine kinase n=1 Tax=Streptomyces sp. NPDC003077 TaxID=3154443 RepID=UPI0033B1673B